LINDDEGKLRAVLQAARTAVDTHRRERLEQGHEAEEPELTVALCKAAWPTIKYAQFTTLEEGRLGADWLWWFLDQSGECFGTLVQAKRLFRKSPGHWWIDFGYRSGERPQINKLLDAADHFEVPASYILYCGDSRYRDSLPCGPEHIHDACPTCERHGVSLLSGPCAKYLVEYGEPADVAFRRSIPLEDLASPKAFDGLSVVTPGERVFDVNLKALSTDLKAFLLSPQNGTRQIAKALFAAAAEMRTGHLAGAVTLEAPSAPGRVFPSAPLDTGHFGLAYYDHILRGLRTELPSVVQSVVLDGQPDTDGELADLAGVVVVHV
jgi:hypothetical protein